MKGHSDSAQTLAQTITQRDLRDTALYKFAESIATTIWQPGSGQIADAAELSVSGANIAFTGTLVNTLSGVRPTRVCLLETDTAQLRVMTFGPNNDRQPKFSMDGRQLGFLSDRAGSGNYQLYLLDRESGASRPTPAVDGWIEYFHWCPKGRRILLAVAGHGADIAGGHGAVTSKQRPKDLPSWMPRVETGDENFLWRRAWISDLDAGRVMQVSAANQNIWETTWCGDKSIAAVTSSGPGEGLWYSARLELIDIATGHARIVYQPRDQLGWLAGSPSGRYLAFVEAVCSDRWIVAGDLKLIDLSSGDVSCLDTAGVDVSYTEWRDDNLLLFAGHRGLETVVGTWSAASGKCTELWASSELTTPGRYASVAGTNASGDCVLVGEGFMRAPEIAAIRQGKYSRIKSLDVGFAEHSRLMASAEPVSWKAPDGLHMQGWLLLPDGKSPFPLVMAVHGGPVLHWRPNWLGRSSFGLSTLLLLSNGYATFLPNPRGSSGRGQEFARRIVGDMGGADALDCLSGIDALVNKGVVDSARLGVTGASYGGFMTCWLIGQDSRFAAAVPVAPVTNQISERLVSNIPHFNDLFLAEPYWNPDGQYFERSPIMYARRVKTPTLNICGALDRCTPPEEAMQFHSALVENGVESVLVTYPEEGHGVRSFPADLDYATRVASWFFAHMPRGVG